MRTWQVVAGLAALALVAVGARLLRNRRKPSQLAFVLLLVPVPATGLAVYALVPGPAPSVTAVTVVSSLLLVLAAFPAWSGTVADRWRVPIVTARDFTFMNRHILARRGCALLSVSGYLFIFEPWFAITNLLAIAAWTAYWIPRRTREQHFEVSREIGAKPETTLKFMIEPSNWIRFRTDVEEVHAEPAGPLAVGTVLTTRRAIPGAASAGPKSYVERLRVTAMTASSYLAVMLDRDATVATELRPSKGGTRITGSSNWVTPFTDAVLGLRLDERETTDLARESVAGSYYRLDELLGSGK